MSESLFIYVHGFNSSPQSMKAQLFKRVMDEKGRPQALLIPELPSAPADAMKLLVSLVEHHSDKSIVLLGSSLGGYYSTWLVEHYAHVKAVLINPSVRPFELLPQYLGENTNLYTGETYILTSEHMQQLLAIQCEEIKRPEAFLLMVQTADETLNYQEAVDKFPHSPQFIQPGGSHGFERFEDMIPAIFAFAQGRIELPEAQPIELERQE